MAIKTHLVFCKNCDYYKEGCNDPLCCSPDICLLKPIISFHPVKGKQHTYITCRSRNGDCNCFFFEPRRSFWKRLFRIE